MSIKQRFCSNGISLTQNFRLKGSPSTNHFSCDKTRINVLSCKNLGKTSFYFVTINVFDGRMDGEMDGILITTASCNRVRCSLITLYGRITVGIWYYSLSVSVCLTVFTYCLSFTALWRINVFIIPDNI